MGNLIQKVVEAASAPAPFKIIFNGLDAAGKTTIFYKLFSNQDIVTTIPTIGFNVETTKYQGMTINGWDVGGRSKIRPLLRHYYPETNGLVFVIDSSDKERIIEAKEQIDILVAEDLLVGLPLLIFANKQDLPNAMSPVAIEKVLDLQSKLKGKRSFLVQPCCATSKEGLQEGMGWLRQEMGKQRIYQTNKLLSN